MLGQAKTLHSQALASLNLSLLLLFAFSSHVIHEQLPHLLMFYVHIKPITKTNENAPDSVSRILSLVHKPIRPIRLSSSVPISIEESA